MKGKEQFLIVKKGGIEKKNGEFGTNYYAELSGVHLAGTKFRSLPVSICIPV